MPEAKCHSHCIGEVNMEQLANAREVYVIQYETLDRFRKAIWDFNLELYSKLNSSIVLSFCYFLLRWNGQPIAVVRYCIHYQVSFDRVYRIL